MTYYLKGWVRKNVRHNDKLWEMIKHIWVESKRSSRTSMFLKGSKHLCERGIVSVNHLVYLEIEFHRCYDRELQRLNNRDSISPTISSYSLMLSEFCFWSEETALNWLKRFVKFSSGFNTKHESVELTSLP